MLDYVYGYDEIVADFVAQLIPHCHRGFGPNIKAVGVVSEGNLIAGLIYHNWDPEAGSIEISAAALPGQNWLTRETIKRMYQFPFLQLGCQMVVQRVPGRRPAATLHAGGATITASSVAAPVGP